MRKRLKITRLEEAVDLIHIGAADSVQATAEYRGQDYSVEVKPKKLADDSARALPEVSPTLNAMMLSAKLEKALFGEHAGNRSRIDEMPWLTLPPGYSFKVTFPFCGAAARFRVCKTDRPDRDVSVYLDTQHVLGYFGMPGEKPVPYWEAYPIGDDTARFALHETAELVAAIIGQLDGDQPTSE